MLLENKNYGVLYKDPEPTDYRLGDSNVEEVVIKEDGDWRGEDAEQEHQSGNGDKMDCVTVSSGNACIERILNYLYRTGKLSQRFIDWLKLRGFFDGNGKIRISTDWAAIQNGTTSDGNYLNVVGQWWHENGIIPASLLPNMAAVLNWQDFYNKARITDEMRQIAKESLEFLDIRYKWVTGGDDDMRRAQKCGVVQVATAVCAGWSTDRPVKGCNQPMQHATALEFVEGDGKRDIWDSYDPHGKQLNSDYSIPAKMLYIVKEKENQDMPQYYIIKQGKKMGVMVAEGFTFGGAFVANPEDFERLKDAVNAPANMPVVELPDANNPS